MAPKPHRPFSTASLANLAGELGAESQSDKTEAILHKLLQIDQEIHADLSAMRADLSCANDIAQRCQNQLESEISLRRQIELDRDHRQAQIQSLQHKLARLSQHQPNAIAAAPTGTSSAETPAVQPHALTDLLNAREDAYRNQQTLVERLKCDNRELKATYDKLWERYQLLYKKQHDAPADDKIEHLSLRVHHAGQAACNVASQVEQRLQLTAMDIDNLRAAMSPRQSFASLRQRASARSSDGTLVFDDAARATRVSGVVSNLAADGPICAERIVSQIDDDRCSTAASRDSLLSDDHERLVHEEELKLGAAGIQLMKTLQMQQEAHERLRSTVVELTKELERIGPDVAGDVQKSQEQLRDMEKSYGQLQTELENRDAKVSELKKQLNKVVAEYEAISVAHSYSNAELSKIRATNRSKTKIDRPHGHSNGVLEGVENLLHHRKNYFR